MNRKFKCVESGRIIGDIKKLSRVICMDETTLYRYIRAGKECKGKHYVAVYDPHPGRGVCKPIRCVETGHIFDSIGQAAMVTYVSKQALSQCLRGKANTCGGYHWSYA